MHLFLKNIIPRIQQYSKDLERVEIFVDKPWIYIDEQSNHHEYIFMRDHRLIMSLNGNVKIGKWEMLPNKKLLVNRLKDEILYENAFIDDALFILQKSGSQENSFVLININKIPDLDALKYLSDIEEKKKIPENRNEKGGLKLLRNGEIYGSDIMIGANVQSHDGRIVSGIFKSGSLSENAFIEVSAGVVTRVFYILTYFTTDNKQVEIEQMPLYGLVNARVITNLLDINKKPNEKFILKDSDNIVYEVIVNEENIITNIIDVQERAFIMWVIVGIFLLGLIVFFSITFAS